MTEASDEQRPTVLIVDDDPNVTSSLARSLRDRFTIFTATDAETALHILQQQPVAVILTDQRMPTMSGVELLARARELQPEARGFIISGYTDPAALIEAINLGSVQGFMSKPWDIAALRRKLEQLVQEYQIAVHERRLAREAQAQIAMLRQLLDQAQADDVMRLELVQWENEVESSATSAPAMGSPLAQTSPALFNDLVANYSSLLDLATEQRGLHDQRSMPDRLRVFSERLGLLWAGPRDVIEIHTQALRRLCRGQTPQRIAVYMEEGRLMLLELMGHLVNFYRIRLAAQSHE
ncbi:response regulator [Chloroflexus aggregans]|uniref:Response regulator receiver protein n=1 Tax=Chloroflexus aggregans (strain MD-66 / DSM 9485) TaxID=326427 RepID=B8G5S0_CHLAD|nr:response regulator [Chloroflexus aggregans]ACL23781.1 response regulator receiver protein [Chloroflexus aggregans DSM 9485]